jgi:Ca2+-binding EF-hand superfamily protein
MSVTHSLYFKTKEKSAATGEEHVQYHRLTQLITSEVRRGDENFVNHFKIIMVNRDGFNPADVLDGEHVNTFAHELSVLPTT